jgi:hypothetical protein
MQIRIVNFTYSGWTGLGVNRHGEGGTAVKEQYWGEWIKTVNTKVTPIVGA